jgi:hypothetical protein
MYKGTKMKVKIIPNVTRGYHCKKFALYHCIFFYVFLGILKR